MEERGLVRNVEVKVGGRTFQRPIQKLARLPWIRPEADLKLPPVPINLPDPELQPLEEPQEYDDAVFDELFG